MLVMRGWRFHRPGGLRRNCGGGLNRRSHRSGLWSPLRLQEARQNGHTLPVKELVKFLNLFIKLS